mmetsp:Transcript_86071/g.174740  ORF Transcript_86071/g.174740 Transcript_86071/m.174740 type:complete len:278 (+) Transcript_86071:1236-2069(+)
MLAARKGRGGSRRFRRSHRSNSCPSNRARRVFLHGGVYSFRASGGCPLPGGFPRSPLCNRRRSRGRPPKGRAGPRFGPRGSKRRWRCGPPVPGLPARQPRRRRSLGFASLSLMFAFAVSSALVFPQPRGSSSVIRPRQRLPSIATSRYRRPQRCRRGFPPVRDLPWSTGKRSRLLREPPGERIRGSAGGSRGGKRKKKHRHRHRSGCCRCYCFRCRGFPARGPGGETRGISFGPPPPRSRGRSTPEGPAGATGRGGLPGARCLQCVAGGTGSGGFRR